MNNQTYAKMKYEKLIYLDFMKSIKNNSTPGNDALTKEFYETFWDELKTHLMQSINRAFCTKILSILQRQAVINLIEKKDCDKRYFKNWKPISLLNVNKKHFSKAISKKLEAVLPTLISSQQTVYVKNIYWRKW